MKQLLIARQRLLKPPASIQAMPMPPKPTDKHNRMVPPSCSTIDYSANFPLLLGPQHRVPTHQSVCRQANSGSSSSFRPCTAVSFPLDPGSARPTNACLPGRGGARRSARTEIRRRPHLDRPRCCSDRWYGGRRLRWCRPVGCFGS